MQFNQENKLSQSQTDFWNLFANSQFDFSLCFAEIWGYLNYWTGLEYTGLYWMIHDFTRLNWTMLDYNRV